MTSDVRPLALYPWPPTPEQVDLIKRAKAELATDFQVVPVEGVPGGPVRILAFGKLPPFVCDTALVRDATSYTSVLAALRWVLTAEPGDDRGFMLVDYLRSILGADVKEIADDGYRNPDYYSGNKSRVAFR